MIEIRNLTVRYGALTAVDNLTLTVAAGELFGLIGSNGAGKTTTLKVACGLLPPDAGTVLVDGRDVSVECAAVKGRTGYMADFFGVYEDLTTHEYLEFFGGLHGVEEAALARRIDDLLARAGLEGKRDEPVRGLSRGMKQRLYFARALVHDPAVLILDEPASGMDPRGRLEMADLLRECHAAGKTIVLSSHILGELEDLCTSIGILERGRLLGVRPLGGAAGPAERRVVLHVCPEDLGRACEALGAMPSVFEAQPEGDRIAIRMRDDDAAESDLVRSLAVAGVRLRLPRQEGGELEKVFLRMTRGDLA